MADNRFTNRQRAIARLGRMPKAVRVGARSQLYKEGDGMVAAIKPRVPIDEAELVATVKWQSTRDTATKISIVVTEGEGGQEEKARANEFGRGGENPMEAQPHFFPTYRQRRTGIRRRMTAAIRKVIRSILQ